MYHATHNHPLPRFSILAVLIFFGFATSLRGDVPPTFDESAEVTAIDMVVEIGLTRTQALWNAETDPPLPKLDPSDFELRVDGTPRPVVAVDAPDLQTGASPEPWTLVLYFDQPLLTAPGLSWAAVQLGVAAERLTALGAVDIVVADPQPRHLLKASTDPAVVRAVLAQLALEPEEGDALVRLRDDFVVELKKRETEMSDAELVDFAISEERRMVQEQHDEMLDWLVGHSEGRGSRRAVFLISDGYDLAPEAFYRERTTLAGEGDHRLDAATAALAETLSAYGWIVFPVVPPPDPPPPKGLRIGKWLGQAKVKPEVVEMQRNPWNPAEKETMMIFNLFSAKRQHQREPDKAESYLGLGRALTEQGELDDAEEALHQAIYHFAQDPRTNDKQALAWGFLGDVLDRQGRVPESRIALKRAHKLAPGNELFVDVPDGELLAPLAPLTTLASVSTGALVRSDAELERAFVSLGRRVRLTYQMPGAQRGALHAVEVTCGKLRCPVNAPGFSRTAVPETVAAARLRRLLAGRLLDGDWRIEVRLHTGENGRWIEVAMPRPVEWGEEKVPELRIGLGYGDPEAAPIVEHRGVAGEESRETTWRWQSDLDVPGDRVWVAALVEDVSTGRWGGRMVEIDPSAGFGGN